MSEQLLPTTMVGSYPRPSWFEWQLAGRDVLEAFKVIHHAEAFEDAVRTVLRDQELAGLDIVTDGQMWFDDYSMGIGSFLWYWLERIDGFGSEKLPHPAASRAKGRDNWALGEAGGVSVKGPIARGPIRMAELYRIASRNTDRPVKACVGAGPVQLSTLAHFMGGPIKDRYELAFALSEIFAMEIADLVEEGCRHIQLEDLGAWIPNLSGEADFQWVLDVVKRTMEAIPSGVMRSWHFCLGNAWGNKMQGMTAGGYEQILHRYYEAEVHEYVLDFACRDMQDAALLETLPQDKRVAVGVIDVRSLEIEAPKQVAARLHEVMRYVPAERITVTTDCGMKQLPRPCAIQKLHALVRGTELVRAELEGRKPTV
ncbi:MAG: cobalamin-independent methionine synthase II family protein [Myxococcota bacterium]|nr:cobalamin-independent methionine synthase II family protein [Myxococcota bacterium]